jgi:hypothetical protein
MTLTRGNHTMSFIRRIMHRNTTRPAGSRFDRYYGRVLRSGTGYPTADEARRDLTAYDHTMLPFGWPH